MTMSLSTGLISGMDTGALIAQLIKAEAAPQTLLKSRLNATQVSASAYRAVNSAFLALSTAAETALKPATWASAKGTSSSTGVAVATGAAATTGSLVFTVPKVATTHATVSTGRWGAATTAAGITTIDVRTTDGSASKGTIALDGTETLNQVATKINGSGLNLAASVVQVRPGEFALQVASTKSGADASFSLAGAQSFLPTTVGQNAEIKIGTGAGAYSVYSATNTFDGVLPGATLTVSREEATPVTVSVVADPDAVAAKVSALVDALNATLTTVRSATSNAPGSTAPLRGEFNVSSLGSRLLEAVSDAVGKDGSPAQLGLQLAKDGKVTFDKDAFLTALKNTPDLAQRMISGSPARTAPDGTPVAAVTGIAGRLLAVTKVASDSATGSLVSLAKGQDSLVRDIQTRIEAWDVRLAKRKQILTRQFTAMETALSSLQNQSAWLAGQIKSLPS